MSASRYPKRRRVSERTKEATPPPVPEIQPIQPEPEPRRYAGSPDELAASSDHQKPQGRRIPFKPSRTNSQRSRASSQPKRGRKGRPKSNSEKNAAPEVDPNELILNAAAPEASSDELNATPPTVSKSATEADPNEVILEAAEPEASYQELQATAVADTQYRRSPESPAISPLSALNNLEELPDAAESIDKDGSEKLPDDAGTIFQDPFNESSNTPAAATSAQVGSDELAIETAPERSVPTLIRTDTNTTTTFRGSFSQKVPPPPNHRYISASPPPYSRISTPIATPRELPTRPPQYVPYRQKMVLKGHKGGVAAVRFSPDGRLIASCCESTSPERPQSTIADSISG